MSQIINKVQHAYSSYFALLKKGYRANIPNFLDCNGMYVLPFSARSRKEVIINNVRYYRLTVGATIANNYPSIIDNRDYICVNNTKENKLYARKDDLMEIQDHKVFKKDNYIVNNKYYIPKKSPNIIESYYIYIKKPLYLNKYKLKMIEIAPVYDGKYFKVNFTYTKPKNNNIPTKDKYISIDLGMNNILAIHNPNGPQHLIKGDVINGINRYYNNRIDHCKSLLSKQENSVRKKQQNETIESYKESVTKRLQKELDLMNDKAGDYVPVRTTSNAEHKKRAELQAQVILDKREVKPKSLKTSNMIRQLLRLRGNKIDDYFNRLVHLIATKYKDCEKIIVGKNVGWKNGVNMGKKQNRKFYDIPYRKLLTKLKDKLEEQNQELIMIEESYTSKCDALALEELCKHKEYKGTRSKRLFYSSTGVIINADINGAINIMRKWYNREGKEMNRIKGEKLCNPKKILVPRS